MVRETDIKTLERIEIPKEIKVLLRKEAKFWVKYIKNHVREIHSKGKGLREFADYHQGEINFIELFFNLDKNKGKNKKNG